MYIRIINPNSTASMTRGIEAAARSVAGPEIRLDAVNPESGPLSIQGFLDGALCLPGLIDLVEDGERQGVDGYLIACFDDTGLDAARTCAQGPVMGLCEAGIKAATIVATGFSIVTTLPRSVPVIRRLVTNYGADRQCLSIRASGVPVLALEEDGGEAAAAIRRHAIAARDEDGAECVVLGCAGMAALADDLTETLGIPVIDPVRIGTALLEGLIRSGIRTSKTGGYAAPDHPLHTHPLHTDRLQNGAPSGRP